jgi:hypothetical protein
MDTQDLNKAFREQMKKYADEKVKAEYIKGRVKAGLYVSKEDINWLCDTLIYRDGQLESAMYDHG